MQCKTSPNRMGFSMDFFQYPLPPQTTRPITRPCNVYDALPPNVLSKDSLSPHPNVQKLLDSESFAMYQTVDLSFLNRLCEQSFETVHEDSKQCLASLILQTRFPLCHQAKNAASILTAIQETMVQAVLASLHGAPFSANVPKNDSPTSLYLSIVTAGVPKDIASRQSLLMQ